MTGTSLDLKINKSEVIDMLIEEQKTVVQEAIELEQKNIDGPKVNGWRQELEALELKLKKAILKNECSPVVAQLKTLHKSVNSTLDFTAAGYKKAPKTLSVSSSDIYRHNRNQYEGEDKSWNLSWSVPTHIILSNRELIQDNDEEYNCRVRSDGLGLIVTNHQDKRPESVFWLRFTIDMKSPEHVAFMKRFTEIKDYIDKIKFSLKEKNNSLNDLKRKTGSIKAKMVRNLLGSSDEGKKLLGQMDTIKTHLFSVAQITTAANVQTDGTKKR